MLADCRLGCVQLLGGLGKALGFVYSNEDLQMTCFDGSSPLIGGLWSGTSRLLIIVTTLAIYQ